MQMLYSQFCVVPEVLLLPGFHPTLIHNLCRCTRSALTSASVLTGGVGPTPESCGAQVSSILVLLS